MGIRVVPNETVPRAIYRILLPQERGVITVRLHPAILIKPVAHALGGLALAGLISTIAHLDSTVLLVVWLLWLVLAGRLLFKIYEWLDDYFVVTSVRLLLARGVFKKTVSMMPLTKVTDMRFVRSPMGRLLDSERSSSSQPARSRRCAPSIICPIPNSSTSRCAA